MRKLASVRKIAGITPIPGADAIELAVVDGWKCVTKKGEFQVGDLVIYCEIDSFLPVKPEFEFLRKTSFKKMGDEEGFRLKTIRMRGQISQGLLLPVSVLDQPFSLGDDVTEQLDIQKYEQPIPACLGGSVVGPFPSGISKTDEERIQNLASDYDSYFGKPFFVTEKVDGTSFTAFYNDGEFGVCGRNWQLAEDDKNSYWQMAKQLDLQTKFEKIGRRLAIQGELIGPGIQSNRYKLKQLQLLVFNVFDIDEHAYLDKTDASELCQELGVEQVPYLETRTVPQSMDEILDLAEGKSVLNPQTEREGLVWVYGSGRDRVSFKTISNKFLAKGGD